MSTDEFALLGVKLTKEHSVLFNSIKIKYENYIADWNRGKDYDFIDHGKNHTNRVLKILDTLLAKQTNNGTFTLNEIEAFVLAISALLHDCGMNKSVYLYENGYNDFDYTRKFHSELSTELVKKIFSDDIDPKSDTLVEVVSEIIRAHRSQSTIDIYSIEEEEWFLSQKIRVRVLGALLRIADEFDNDLQRAPKLTEKSLGRINENAIKYWRAIQSIQSIDFDTFGQANIKFTRSISYDNQINSYLVMIKKMYFELSNVISIFSSNGISLSKIYLEKKDIELIEKFTSNFEDFPINVKLFILASILGNKIDIKDQKNSEKSFKLLNRTYFLLYLSNNAQKTQIRKLISNSKNNDFFLLFWRNNTNIEEFEGNTKVIALNIEEKIDQIIERVFN